MPTSDPKINPKTITFGLTEWVTLLIHLHIELTIYENTLGCLTKNNSFETALPCRPRTCLSTTLQSNLFQRDAENSGDPTSIVHIT